MDVAAAVGGKKIALWLTGTTFLHLVLSMVNLDCLVGWASHSVLPRVPDALVLAAATLALIRSHGDDAKSRLIRQEIRHHQVFARV